LLINCKLIVIDFVIKNRNEIKDFRDLEIYKIAEKIALELEKITKKLPPNKKGLGEHLVKEGVSTLSNIAEAYGRYFFKESLRFYYYARGSNCEVHSRLRFFILTNYFTLEETKEIFYDIQNLKVKLNNTISSTYKQIKKNIKKQL